jgi:hypothetical protein
LRSSPRTSSARPHRRTNRRRFHPNRGVDHD